MTLLPEDDPGQQEKIESLRYTLVGKYNPYKGKFRKMNAENQDPFSCLFTSEPAPPLTLVAQSVGRKDYSYLKPSVIVRDCNEKLNKLGLSCAKLSLALDS